MAHYHIINPRTGGRLNKVTQGENERDSDARSVRDAKRLALAKKKRDGWQQTTHKGEELVIKETPSHD